MAEMCLVSMMALNECVVLNSLAGCDVTGDRDLCGLCEALETYDVRGGLDD
jgi:hypothetical protein